MNGLLAELRLAARTLARAPAFSLMVVVILALGIGTTSAVFTVVNAVLLRPLPFPEADRLVLVRGVMHRTTADEWPMGYQDIGSLAERRAGLAGIAAVTGSRSFNFDAGNGEIEHLSGEMVSGEYFGMLGARPLFGRLFTAEESRTAAPVVVIGEDLWRRRFGADRGVLGRQVVLNERSYELIGVVASGFRGLNDDGQLWLPIGLAGGIYGAHYLEVRQFRWLSGLAKLAPALDVAQAQRLVDSAGADMAREFPADNKDLGFKLTPLAEVFFGSLRGPLTALLAASAFVLLIACANVSALLLVRGTARRRETSLRLALGSGHRGIVRQLAAEGTVLAAAGCAAGLALAMLAVQLLVRGSAAGLPSFAAVGMDWRVAVVAVAVSAVSVLTFGFAPALLATRVSPLEGLKDGGGSSGGRRAHASRRALVALEVALAVVLLVGAARMIGEFRRTLAADLGMRTAGVLSARVDLTGPGFATPERATGFARDALRELAAMPGAATVALEGPGLPTGGWYGAHFRRAEDAGTQAEALVALRHHVSPGYFATLGIPLRAGRDFTESDALGAERVIILSESMARRAWPDQPAVGRQLLSIGPQPVPLTVIGVVGDVRQGGYGTDGVNDPNLYLPILQSPPRSPALVSILVRTGGDAAALGPSLSSVVRRVAPALPVYDVRTLDDRLRDQTRSARLLLALMSGFAGIALLLAAAGVYGVSAAAVHEARRDIGIRMALGASARSVCWLVARQGVIPVVIGLAAGIAAVVPLGRLAGRVLQGLDAGTPGLVAAMVVTLLVAALAASAVPVYRALRVDPLAALRRD